MHFLCYKQFSYWLRPVLWGVSGMKRDLFLPFCSSNTCETTSLDHIEESLSELPSNWIFISEMHWAWEAAEPLPCRSTDAVQPIQRWTGGLGWRQSGTLKLLWATRKDVCHLFCNWCHFSQRCKKLADKCYFIKYKTLFFFLHNSALFKQQFPQQSAEENCVRPHNPSEDKIVLVISWKGNAFIESLPPKKKFPAKRSELVDFSVWCNNFTTLHRRCQECEARLLGKPDRMTGEAFHVIF